MKFYFVLIISLLILACGKKDLPYPKDTLNIPKAEAVSFAISDEGVDIENPTEYTVVVDRANAEIGDIGFPMYVAVANIPPKSSFIDDTIRKDTRYVYRVRTKHAQYDAYSAPIMHTIAYQGSVSVTDLKWTAVGDALCLNIAVTEYVERVKVLINGRELQKNKAGCYDMPPTARILLVAVPYDEAGIAGRAASTTIDRSEDTLLPPQNVQIIRRNTNGMANITISWSKAANARQYIITATEPNRPPTRAKTDNTLYTWQTSLNNCVNFDIATDTGEELSAVTRVTSCP